MTHPTTSLLDRWFPRRGGPRGRLALQRLGALLAALLLVLPASVVTAAPGQGARAVVDDDLTRHLQDVAEEARVPVLVEGSLAKPLGPSARANVERAERAGSSAARAGGSVRGHLGLVGAVVADLTPAEIRRLAADPDVGRVMYDRPVQASALPTLDSGATPIVFQDAVEAPDAWRQGYTGKGVGIAILDSGIAESPALGNRVKQRVDFVSASRPERGDPGGHGTHLAGIIAAQTDTYRGIAPDAKLVAVRVLDANGQGRLSTVIRGLEWTIKHRHEQDLRVVVLAISAPAAGSYRTDPLAAAVELAWRAGLVVVSSAGNGGPGSGTLGTPGDDPLVITVGATDDAGTVTFADDTVPFFSSRGPTADGVAKPDLVAPGRKIVSLRVPGSTLDQQLPTHREGSNAFRLTGTSMSTAIVAGAVADLLQQRPRLTPDGVKAILTRSARPLTGVDRTVQGAGSVDVRRALATATPPASSARQSVRPSDGFLRTVLFVLKLSGMTLRGNQVQWDQVQWDQVQWDQVQWDQVQWDQVQWDQVQWDQVQWDQVQWDQVQWDAGSRSGSEWVALD